MIADQFRKLFAYNYWANHRLFAKTAALSTQQFIANNRFSHGGLRSTFAHLLYAEWVWRMRIMEHSPLNSEKEPEAEDFSDLSVLMAAWEPEERKFTSYVNRLTDADLGQSLKYQGGDGRHYELPLADVLFHVVNHGMQHRSELAQMLTELGQSPGDIDYSLYRREYAK